MTSDETSIQPKQMPGVGLYPTSRFDRWIESVLPWVMILPMSVSSLTSNRSFSAF